MTTPATIWITGITASGKTTLGRKLYQYLQSLYPEDRLEFLDGDEIRKKLDREYGHSTSERMAVLGKIVEMAEALNQRGKIVIVSTVSHKKEMREFARSRIAHFFEVYLQCSVKDCAERDYKGHYQKAMAGEYDLFAGVTEPYETSEAPELVLDTASQSIEVCSQTLCDRVTDFLTHLNP